jgi:uroporphyrin-III C-methyltransferase / precorrin-2 dehydrogenase / sirohydrochlorin ferrochelatase
MNGRGLVSLVGAGPGDPDHLTQKATRRLRDADVVMHDALVSADVCALAVNALLINVGKRAGREQTPQREIERLMIDAAQQGLRVVRLKGGDPFVFGRGGEEALALQRAGIPFEIVPGITTAIAAPGLAGIPVTHRGVSSGFVVLNGSDLESVDRVLASIDPGSLTVVLLMAIGARAKAADRLVARGWDVETPAAIVIGAATPEMWTWRGRLADLGTTSLPESSAAGTIVVGEVAGLPIVVESLKGQDHVHT